ncbi:MAG: M42 family metallopeptidase [Clostridiaceae bacterium]|jgi:endoglucanase|nr:M42 family metallopeptidase [Clostridiaceae bacterium]
MECSELLKKLSDIRAVAGRENMATEKIAELFREYCDDVSVDAFYNVIGFKKGQSENPKNVLVTAHYDEIGLMVTGIEDSGFLRFTAVGGVDAKVIGAMEVTVHGKEDLFGVIGVKPPHLIPPGDKDKGIKMEDMRIDIGYGGEKARELVSIGDMVSFNSPARELLNNRIAGKSMDNRSGVAALIEILKELQKLKHDDNVYVVATVQEELGLIGAICATYNIKADLGIVIDVCHGDMPDAPSDEAFPLDKGVAVAIGPIISRKHAKECIKLADEENIPYQIDPEAGDTGTEAAVHAVAREGIPVILLSVPSKYMHTTVEMVSVNDVVSTGRLAARYIAGRSKE